MSWYCEDCKGYVQVFAEICVDSSFDKDTTYEEIDRETRNGKLDLVCAECSGNVVWREGPKISSGGVG